MELDVVKWINCFSRKETDDAAFLNGSDEEISDLTGGSTVKSSKFNLYKYTKKTTPTLIEADKYYNYYNTQVVRFDVSFLTNVSTDSSGKEKLTYTPINGLDNEFGTLEQDGFKRVSTITSNYGKNQNNNFFVSATIEDFGSYKTLNLTLKDRTFNTLAGYIYQAIECGNGNTKVFGGGDSSKEIYSDDETIKTELTESTTLKFLKTPQSNKIKQNLKIRYGYQTTTRDGQNNFPKTNDSYWSDMFGESSHRWTTATKWEGSTNIDGVEVTPNKVLAIRKHQTTKVTPEMDFFITDLSTTLTQTGVVYNIKASSTENFVLNNIKFIQQYTVLRGKPKSLLASLMKVFNSNEEAPVKLVWCDNINYINYLNGSDIMKNYKTGEFELMEESSLEESLKDDRKTLNDINRQIEILSDLRNVFTYDSGNSIKIGDSDLGYKKLGSKAIENLKKQTNSNLFIDKHNFSNVFFYPVRQRLGSHDEVDDKVSYSNDKLLLYIADIKNNYKFFGKEENAWIDNTIEITSKDVLGSWLNFIKVKGSKINNPDAELNREMEEYKSYMSVLNKNSAFERLTEAKNSLKREYDNIATSFSIINDSTVPEYVYVETNLICSGLLTSIPKKDGIRICDENYAGVYLDDEEEIGADYGIFKNAQGETIYDSYSSVINDKDMTKTEDYNEAFKKMIEDSSVWNNLNSIVNNNSKKLILDKDAAYYNLKDNAILLSTIDSIDSSKPGEKFIKTNKEYNLYIKSFLGSKSIKENKESIQLTNTTTNLFSGGILGSCKDLIDGTRNDLGYFGLTKKYGNLKLIKKPSEITVNAEDFQKAKTVLQNVLDRKLQSLQLASSSGGFGSLNNCTVTIFKQEDRPESEGGGKKITSSNVEIYASEGRLGSKHLSDEFKSIFSSSDDKDSVEKVFNFIDSTVQIGDYGSQNLLAIVKLIEHVLDVVKKYKDAPSKTINDVNADLDKLASAVKKYMIKELKNSIARYYIAAIDYYYKAKNVTGEETGSYSWSDLAKQVWANAQGESSIKLELENGRIKKQGEGDSLSFSDMTFGSSIDGTKNYIIEAYKFMDFTHSTDEIETFYSEIGEQITKFLKLKDEINAEYAKKAETKIGKDISISLGSEESQYKRDTFTKSLSSLFNDFCSQCMPMMKPTNIIAASTSDDSGNSTTSTITDEATKQNLTWSVVGKYIDSGGNEKPIIGIYYKEPKIPSYIREYAWGTGNAKMHCIKDINISTASEFAMYSTINTMSLENGKLNSAGTVDFGSDKRLDVSMVSSDPSESSDTFVDTFYPNLVSNSDKQKNLMNNLLQAINKGTMTLLGDPSLVFSGEIQPYTYPIFLNIKLQQEGVSWSGGTTGGVSINTQSYLSGIYVVGKITHNFSMSGYTTNLEIIKYPGLDKEYKNIINSRLK